MGSCRRQCGQFQSAQLVLMPISGLGRVGCGAWRREKRAREGKRLWEVTARVRGVDSGLLAVTISTRRAARLVELCDYRRRQLLRFDKRAVHRRERARRLICARLPCFPVRIPGQPYSTRHPPCRPFGLLSFLYYISVSYASSLFISVSLQLFSFFECAVARIVCRCACTSQRRSRNFKPSNVRQSSARPDSH